jgi:hypothetical protein
MVYALTGLAADIDPELGSHPDYTLCKQEVYKKATWFSLRMERKLFILKVHRIPTPGMPSWIYDWSNPLDQIGWRSWPAERVRLTESRGIYKASLDTTYSGSENITQSLYVDGIYVDQVVVVGDCCTLDHEGTSWKQALRSWRKITADWFHKNSSLAYSRGICWEDGFWRTMMCDVTFDALNGFGSRTSSEDRLSFDIWWSMFLVKDDLRRDEERLMSSYFYGCIAHSIFAAILGRSYFITERGYMGLGDPKVGDQVWVLCGGDIPFILRPSREPLAHYLIRDCYVHGIMDGEAMVDFDKMRRTVVLN